MTFVVDCMLGKAAKWLKIIGFDVLFFPRAEDDELLAVASREMTASTAIVAMYGSIDRYCDGMSTPSPCAWNCASVTPPNR